MRTLKFFPCIILLMTLAACGPSVDNTYSGGNDNGSSNNNTGGTQTGPGYTWQTGTSGTTAGFRSLAFGNGRWVAVGQDAGDGLLAVSSDGLVWTLTSENSLAYAAPDNVAFGNGTFVVVSAYGGILTSTDGVTWAGANVPTSNGSTPYPQQLTAATYGNGLWVAVDNFFLTENGLGIWTSTDNGANWSIELLNTPYAQPTAMAYGNGTFVIVGYGGLLLTSPDGANWTNRSLSSGLAMMSVIYVNNEFVAVTNSGQTVISPDGITWTTYSTLSPDFETITYGNGLYLAAGGVHAYVSQDAQNWVDVTSYLPNANASSFLNGAAYGNGSFVMVGDSGIVDVSP